MELLFTIDPGGVVWTAEGWWGTDPSQSGQTPDESAEAWLSTLGTLGKAHLVLQDLFPSCWSTIFNSFFSEGLRVVNSLILFMSQKIFVFHFWLIIYLGVEFSIDIYFASEFMWDCLVIFLHILLLISSPLTNFVLILLVTCLFSSDRL